MWLYWLVGGSGVVFFQLWRTGEYSILDNFLTVLMLVFVKILITDNY